MPTIDQNVEVGLELAVTAGRLTGKILIAVMDHFLESLEKNKDLRKNAYHDKNTKQGKQNLKDLYSKHSNNSIDAMDANVSKNEIKNIQKELNDMGVDFSVRKIGKDQYSLFYAGKDNEAIEKGLENAIEKYNIRAQRIENTKNILVDFSTKGINEKVTENMTSKIEEIMNAENTNEQQKIIKESSKENKLFDEKPTEKQLELAEKLNVSDFKNMNKVEISLALEKAGADKSFFNKHENKKENSKDKKFSFSVKEMQKKARDKKQEQSKNKTKNKSNKKSKEKIKTKSKSR